MARLEIHLPSLLTNGDNGIILAHLPIHPIQRLLHQNFSFGHCYYILRRVYDPIHANEGV